VAVKLQVPPLNVQVPFALLPETVPEHCEPPPENWIELPLTLPLRVAPVSQVIVNEQPLWLSVQLAGSQVPARFQVPPYCAQLPPPPAPPPPPLLLELQPQARNSAKPATRTRVVKITPIRRASRADAAHQTDPWLLTGRPDLINPEPLSPGKIGH
jgi:hypothetical protein